MNSFFSFKLPIEIPPRYRTIFEFLKIIFFVYCFLLAIDMMGLAFKGSKGSLQPFFEYATANPFIALVIGIVVTSIIQSSSSTTSIVVGLVAAGTLPLENAIPIIMGANIGTTVTNTIVSFGYAGRKVEFERAFGASIVHDMFNIYATIILFPLEMYTHVIYRTSVLLEKLFEGMGGLHFVSPLKFILHPVTEPFAEIIGNHYVLIVISLVFLFFSMKNIIDNMRGVVMEKIEHVMNDILFKNIAISFVLGIVFTSIVQSSSITTSLIIPLVGAGVLSLEQIFPYTLGANIGTTITAFLAALTLGVGAGMTIAIAHLVFNIFGIVTVYPLKFLPLGTARFIASFVSQSRKNFIIFLIIYIALHVVPIVFAVL